MPGGPIMTQLKHRLDDQGPPPKIDSPTQVKFIPLDLDWWPLTTFAGIVGWSRRKADSKIRRQEWSENVHYRYEPDLEIDIYIREYCRWVESGPGSKRDRRQCKSGSTGSVSAFGKRSTGNPPQLTQSAPGVSGVASPL